MIENLSREQLAAILETLPMDITFVDENETVLFWNKHDTRSFERPTAVLGKSARSCHTQHSLAKVDQLLSDLKSGKQDSAALWLDLKGRKIYIRYFAVRGEGGSYLGTLEATQDITDIKKIEGEKRILEY